MYFVPLVSVLFYSVSILNAQINDKKFPDGFMFGVATSSYQVEGAWNEDGKGPNIWDTITHEKPDYVKNRDNGDITCDSYHKYKEDVQLLKSLGVKQYRFSISWSRILPTGYANKINVAGVNYYRNLIKELRANNIEPLATIYHWDLPELIHEAGGWPNPNIIQWYTDYARICFQLFGDLVKYWITFNEPISFCHLGYGKGDVAPAIKSAEAEFLCSHHVLLAHANVYHMYNQTFKKTQKGNVGIVIVTHYFKPESNKPEDLAAAETYLQFMFGWYANPLVYGDYPAVMKEHVARHSKAAGFKNSLLPEFSAKMSAKLKGTLDYLGVNMYTSFIAKATNKINNESAFWEDCVEADTYQLPSWKSAASYWLKLTPWGLGELVKWVSRTYNSIPIIITENGMSDNGTSLQDDLRIEQIQTYLSSLRDAMEDNKVKVFGYTYWSFMDNFEWRSGYSEKFGITHVDFTSPNRTRTPKKSFDFYKKIIKTNCLVDKCRE